MALTADNWNVDADGDWETASNWSTDKLPTSNNTVTISTADVHTVTHSTGNDVIDKLTVGPDFFDLSGGSLDILTTASFADGYTQTGGSLQVGAIGITGPAMLMGGASEGSTAFTVKGTTTLSNYTLGGASQLAVATLADQTGQITLGDANGVGAAISIAAAATYDIAGDFGVTQGAASGAITNAGTLEKGSGSGTSAVNASLTSTGTLTAASGVLEFSGPTNSISGTLAGAGQIAFGGGVTTLGKITASVGTLGVEGNATLDLGANLGLTSVFTDTSYGANTVNLGKYTLEPKGPSALIAGNFGTALITGSGVFDNASVLTLGGSVEFGGTLLIENNKTIDQTSGVTLGDGSGSAPSFTNEAKGVYDFTSDASINENGATVAYDNLGTLEKTGTGGTSTIGLAVTNSGTISAQSGVLNFDNSLTNTGTLSGSAALQISGSGVLALNAGSVLSVATLDLNDSSTLNLGASLSYAGVFSDVSYGANHLNLGTATLTLSGKSNSVVGSFGSAIVAGAGVLANTGTLTLASAIVDGTASINNTGVINQTGGLTIGGGGGQIASLVNAKGGQYNLTGAVGIGNGAAPTSHFDNSGTFTVNAGAGTATINTVFNNLSTGVLNVAGGTLQDNGALVNAGTLSGTALGIGGQATFNAGTMLSVNALSLNGGGVLNLGATLTYSGSFTDSAYGGSTINLGSHDLTLKGAIEFNPIGADDIVGPGTLRTDHTALFDGTIVVGGTAKLEISALTTVTGGVEIGDSSANASTMVIDAAGKYDLTSDSGISRGQSAASTVTNNGLFEKTAGTGTSVVSVDFVNNGAITVTQGTIEFEAGTLSGGGTINGVEKTDSSGNIFITAKSGGSGAHAAMAAPLHASSSSALLVQAAAAFAPSASGVGGTASRHAALEAPMLAAAHLMRA